MTNLTQIETSTLSERLNLADGHAYRSLTEPERAIMANAGELFLGTDRRRLDELEHAYLKKFHQLAGQHFDPTRVAYRLCFTASNALEVLANYFRLKHLSVALIEPCFDNLSDILLRHEVPLTAFDEQLLEMHGPELDHALATLDTDVFFVVSPNNPTGTAADQAAFRQLVDFCKNHDKLLVLDACFRHYLPPAERYDHYAILLEAGINFVVIEDTGKTWPTAEIKGPFFASSYDVGIELDKIYSDFLLHVPVFSLAVMTGFIDLTERNKSALIREPSASNFTRLQSALAGTTVNIASEPFMSVAWLDLTTAERAAEFCSLLQEWSVFVLPGERFYWDKPELGTSFVRVALLRDEDVFRDAVDLIHKAALGTEPSDRR